MLSSSTAVYGYRSRLREITPWALAGRCVQPRWILTKTFLHRHTIAVINTVYFLAAWLTVKRKVCIPVANPTCRSVGWSVGQSV